MILELGYDRQESTSLIGPHSLLNSFRRVSSMMCGLSFPFSQQVKPYKQPVTLEHHGNIVTFYQDTMGMDNILWVILPWLLLLSGDIESNPGPVFDTKDTLVLRSSTKVCHCGYPVEDYFRSGVNGTDVTVYTRDGTRKGFHVERR